MSVMTCGYCGRSFPEDQGQPTCAECPLKGACRFVRCPYCGYENPTTPAWVERLRSWLGAEGRSGRADERINSDAREADR